MLSLAVHADGDTVPDNDVAGLRVKFQYCDARLSRAATVRAIPSEGPLRVPLLLSNGGTAPCLRAGVGVAAGGHTLAAPPRATLDSGSEVDADTTIEVTPPKRGAKSATLRLRALAGDDADTSDDLVITAPVAVVGDSAIRRAGARSVSGSATDGGGAASKTGRRVQAVSIAIRQLGSRCRWLAASGRIRSVSASAKTCAAHPIWLRAHGTRRWSLTLPRALAPGRYVVQSRATIAAGFSEGRFSSRDGNQRTLRVR